MRLGLIYKILVWTYSPLIFINFKTPCSLCVTFLILSIHSVYPSLLVIIKIFRKSRLCTSIGVQEFLFRFPYISSLSLPIKVTRVVRWCLHVYDSINVIQVTFNFFQFSMQETLLILLILWTQRKFCLCTCYCQW